ncbi:hypothetical protein MRX96_012399 [Rhipicephalus microplus]
MDVLVNLNNVPVGETPLAQINKTISSAGEQLTMSVMASSPYRLLTSRRDMLGVMQSIPRECAVVKAAPGSSTGGKTYGITILDVDVTDEKLKRSAKCFMLLCADVVTSNNKMVFPGDVVFEIDGTLVDGMSRPQVDQLLSTGKTPSHAVCRASVADAQESVPVIQAARDGRHRHERAIEVYGSYSWLITPLLSLRYTTYTC